MRRCGAAWTPAILPLSDGRDFSLSLSIVGDKFDRFPPAAATVASDPSARFFQIRARAARRVARLVDGGGSRAGGLPADCLRGNVLSIAYRP